MSGALKQLLNLEMSASTKVAGEQPPEEGDAALLLAAAVAASVQTVARAVYMNAASADVCFYGVAVIERLLRKGTRLESRTELSHCWQLIASHRNTHSFNILYIVVL